MYSIKKERLKMVESTIFAKSQPTRHFNVVSCAGVLADQRFAKNPSMEFVFRTAIFMNTRHIPIIQLKNFTKTYHSHVPFLNLTSL